jgi:hypothetical protein
MVLLEDISGDKERFNEDCVMLPLRPLSVLGLLCPMAMLDISPALATSSAHSTGSGLSSAFFGDSSTFAGSSVGFGSVSVISCSSDAISSASTSFSASVSSMASISDLPESSAMFDCRAYTTIFLFF